MNWKKWKLTALYRYVLQDDKMLGTLTVKEHLTYMALLKLPGDLTYQQKLDRVSSCKQKKLSI
jgi:ABC-type multidrug transport system ATPase subunit